MTDMAAGTAVPALADGLELPGEPPALRSGVPKTLAVNRKLAKSIAPGEARLDPAVERDVVLSADLAAKLLPPARRITQAL